MKNIWVLIFLFIFTKNTGQPSPFPRVSGDSKYSLELSEFISNSGFKSSTAINLKITASDNKRYLIIGPFIDNESMKFAGVNVHPIWILGQKRTFTPHIFYNLLWRISKLPEPLPDGSYGEIGRYASVEHHLGIGAEYKLKKFYIRGEVGAGVYFGSIKKPKLDEELNVMYGSTGFGTIAMFGFGYNF